MPPVFRVPAVGDILVILCDGAEVQRSTIRHVGSRRSPWNPKETETVLFVDSNSPVEIQTTQGFIHWVLPLDTFVWSPGDENLKIISAPRGPVCYEP